MSVTHLEVEGFHEIEDRCCDWCTSQAVCGDPRGDDDYTEEESEVTCENCKETVAQW